MKSEIKYRSIIENMDLGLLEVDTKGTIIRVYDGFNQMTGYEGDELVGKDAKETLLVEGYEAVIDEQENNRLKGKTNVYEVKIKKKNGTEIYVLISGAPFYNEKEEIIGSIGIHYDISERKQLEQDLEIAKQKAIKAQQAEEQFLANMSHEIRTPLNAIIGMSHLLAETNLDQNQTEFLDILSNSASILKNLISDILDISKINAGVLELQGKPVDLKELTHTLITTFNMKNIEKEVQFLLDFDPQINHYIISDPQLINQVLINLLNNAEKFTEQGKISLIVTLIEDQENYYELKVEVQDTGVGIAPENIEKIFQQFKQASGEIRSKYGGTGLGLTISHRFIALLGGNLEVDSIIGEGSNFYFTIKVEKGAKIDEQKKIKTATQQLIPQGEEIQLLVVEDNPMNLKYLTTLLNKWNIQHEVASNGVEAVDLYGQQHFDMILMDLQMPKMDGYEATRIIRSMPEDKREVSIIALTASTFLSKKRLALQAGMTDFLSKPFTPDQLAKVISDQYNFSMQSMEDEHDFIFDLALDQNHLQNAYGSDMNYALDMFETFLEIIEKEMDILEANIKDGTAESIRKQAHKIKPTFTMVGLTALSNQIKTIEELSQTATKNSILNEFENVKTALHKMLPILHKEKERLQANK